MARLIERACRFRKDFRRCSGRSRRWHEVCEPPDPQNGAGAAIFSISARSADIAWRPLAVARRASEAAAQPYAAELLEQPSAAVVVAHSYALAAAMALRGGPAAVERSLSEAVAAAHSPVAAVTVPQSVAVGPLSERGSTAEHLAAASERTSRPLWEVRRPRRMTVASAQPNLVLAEILRCSMGRRLSASRPPEQPHAAAGLWEGLPLPVRRALQQWVACPAVELKESRSWHSD
jgi:hypothetical protein